MADAAPAGMWVDTDIALGARKGDVDDGFALAAVLRATGRQPRPLRLIGVSAVAGNTDAATAWRCAGELMRHESAPVTPVTATAAAAAIAALPPGSRLLALGPLGNLAAALRLEPDLARRLDVWVVATVLDRRRHPLLPWYCLNFRRDPAAARQVMAAPWRRLQVCPLDVVQRLRVGAPELAGLRGASPLGAYLARHSTRWQRQSWWRYRSRRFPAWDLVAALAALDLLPGAEFTQGRLVRFDATAAWRAFRELVGPT